MANERTFLDPVARGFGLELGAGMQGKRTALFDAGDEAQWAINDKPASEDEVVDRLSRADLDSLVFTVSIDGEVVRTGLGIEGATQAARDLADRPTTATFGEGLCYWIAFMAVWISARLMMPDALLVVCAAGVVGMVMVNRRVGLGPLA